MEYSRRHFAIKIMQGLGAGALAPRLGFGADPARPFANAGMAKGAAVPALSPDLQAFAALHPIDTHSHVFSADPAFFAMLHSLQLSILDICVVESSDAYRHALQPQLRDAWSVVRASGGAAKLCTTFDPYAINTPGFTARAVQQINRDFAQGAVAMKLWKNMGMEVRWADGRFVLPDDPVLAPIYKDLAARNKTLVAHLAEPDACWQPLDPRNPNYGYYKSHPEWHMYGKPDHPSKAAILAARDHVLAENPQLRIVGAHLGSMESDLGAIAARLDRYPNFAVDTAARVKDLMLQPAAQVRALILKYPDRFLYGTDLLFHAPADPQEAVESWRKTYAAEWKYFAASKAVDHHGNAVEGLNLPAPILRKLYHDNAVRWVPGIV